eukprot:SAG31_NODE_3810_length_3862_cov_2.467712_2_plen_89_part_00
MIPYIQFNVPDSSEKVAADYIVMSLVLLICGRLVSTALLQTLDGADVMAAFACANVVLCGFGVAVGGKLGSYALVGTSFFMSLMFPTM